MAAALLAGAFADQGALAAGAAEASQTESALALDESQDQLPNEAVALPQEPGPAEGGSVDPTQADPVQPAAQAHLQSLDLEVLAPVGSLPEGAAVTIEPIEEEAQAALLATYGLTGPSCAFDLKVTDAQGQEVHQTAQGQALTLTFAFDQDADLAAEAHRLIHIDSQTGTSQEVTLTADSASRATAQVSAFSPFILTAAPAQTAPSAAPAAGPAKAPEGGQTALYLNGKSGDDALDGTSKDTAVKTFARAKDLAAADPAITTIYVTGTVDLEGDISLAGTNAMLMRDPGFDDNLALVPSGKTATLSDITLDGNSAAGAETVSSLLICQGSLTLNDGAVFQNNHLTYTQDRIVNPGGGITVSGGSLTMTGGLIKKNQAISGGGILVCNGGTFTMTGGTITDNDAIDNSDGDASATGGGVCGFNGSEIHLTGGTISGNRSANAGGGISVGGWKVGDGSDHLTMEGGTVSGNSAGSGGGGIFVQAGVTAPTYWDAYATADISGGTITGNTMTGLGKGSDAFGGAGIYVNGFSDLYTAYGFHDGVLHLTNAVITGNTAAMEGGGYASCPASDTKIYLDDGVALYGNTGSNAKDLYILASNAYGAHSGNPAYDISPLMLGGTAFRWKNEDGTERQLNELKGTLNAQKSEALALHTDEDPGSLAQAKVEISGNTSATRGGGIGSNGTIIMGKGEVRNLTVDKKWDVAANVTLPDAIDVEVYRLAADGTQAYVGVQTIKPDPATGSWSVTIKNLPKADEAGNEYTYTVKERAIQGYKSTLTGDPVNGFTLTNTVKPPTTSVSVSKVWEDEDDREGKRPESITIHLLANGREADVKTLTAQDGWAWTFEDLPQSQDGQDINYTISEDTVEGYTATLTGDVASGFVLTNTVKPKEDPKPHHHSGGGGSSSSSKTTVTVTKVWQDAGDQEGIRPDQVKVELVADGQATGKTLTLSPANKWKASFTGLAKRSGGKTITYTVKEVDLPAGYSQTLTGDASSGFTLTNTHQPSVVSVSGAKIWQDDNDRDGKRPEAITIRLLADGKETAAKTVTAQDGWAWTFDNLPQYADGHKITYTITEDAVKDYSAQVEGYNVTNTYAPAKTSLQVTKVWQDQDNKDGSRPQAVTVRLLADGHDTGKTLILNADNQWTAAFADLDANQSGRAIAYTVAEDPVTGYTSEISGSQEKGYTITNSHTPAETPANTPESKGKADGGRSGSAASGGTASTGDPAGTLPATGLILAGLAAYGALRRLRRKTR